jgi:N utilization substance protein B
VTVSTTPTKRTLAREFAVKFIYHLNLAEFAKKKTDLIDNDSKRDKLQEEVRLFTESYTEHDEEHPSNQLAAEYRSFAFEIITAVFENYRPLEDLVRKHLKNWKLEKVDKIDQAILVVGACELTHFRDTPPSVIINEAVSIAKRYGGGDSYSFINGILDGISKSSVH